MDSGNLAASLITLKQGCLALKDRPIVGAHQWQGILVVLDILSNTLKELEKNITDSAIAPFEVELDEIVERITATQSQPEKWVATLVWLSGEGWEKVSRLLLQILETEHPNLNPEILNELQLYLDIMHHHLHEYAAEYRIDGALAEPLTPDCLRRSHGRKIHRRRPGKSSRKASLPHFLL